MVLLVCAWLGGATLAAAVEMGVVQSIAPTSNGGPQDFTVSGFGTPLCALFFAGTGTVNATAATHAMLAVGITDFTTSYSIASMAEDAQTTSGTGASGGSTALRTLASADQSVDGTATATTITNGARLTWSDAPPSAYHVNGVLFGGTNISDCHVGTLAGNATQDGTASTTAPGFQPDLLVVLTSNGSTAHNRNSIGFAVNDSGVVQRAAGMTDQSGVASMQVGAVLRDDRITVFPLGTGAASLELTSFNPTGFTVATRDAGGSVTIGYLALKFANGVRGKLLTCASPTSTGAHSCTGSGWTPQGGLMLHTESAAVGTYYAADDGEVLGLSAFTTAASGSSAIYSEDGDGTSGAESITATKPVQLRKNGAAYMTATFTGFQSNGADFNYSVAPGVAAQRAVLFIEQGVAGGSTNFMLRRRGQ